MRLPFVQVDAFAHAPFTGNPAAVMVLDEWLPDDTLQAIAAEHNLAETAFLVRDTTGEADWELRWFTPTVEVEMCGHATLASGHHLLGVFPDQEAIRFRTREVGLLGVERDGNDYALSLPSRPPAPRPLPEMLAMMGLGTAADTRWHPAGYGLIVLEDEAAVRAVRPDFRALAALGDTLNIVTARGTGTDIVSRVFAPAAGIDEDPVTGSAHAVLVPYWAEVLGRDRFTAYQASARGGHLDCRLDGDRVVLGGGCVTVIEGVLTLP